MKYLQYQLRILNEKIGLPEYSKQKKYTYHYNVYLCMHSFITSYTLRNENINMYVCTLRINYVSQRSSMEIKKIPDKQSNATLCGCKQKKLIRSTHTLTIIF